MIDWDGVPLVRTGGRHPTGATARLLAPVSGFILGDLYVAGDTVWGGVENAIASHRPRVAIVNGSGARFLDSGPLVMTTSDTGRLVARVPTLVVVHLGGDQPLPGDAGGRPHRRPGGARPKDGEMLVL